jgi:hypothetical protein
MTTSSTTNRLVKVNYVSTTQPVKDVVVTRPEVGDTVTLKQLKTVRGKQRVGIIFKDAYKQRNMDLATAKAFHEALGIVLNSVR